MTKVDNNVYPKTGADGSQLDDPAPDVQRLLQLYLRDHDAAGVGGLRLLRRTCASNADTPFAPALGELLVQVEADAATLHTIATRLDVRRNHIKRSAAWLGVTLGGLKPNARMVSYSPLSRVYEFEALAAGVRAKWDLWQSLRVAARGDTRIDSDELDALTEGADRQLLALKDLHKRAATLAFVRSI